MKNIVADLCREIEERQYEVQDAGGEDLLLRAYDDITRLLAIVRVYEATLEVISKDIHLMDGFGAIAKIHSASEALRKADELAGGKE